MVKTTALSLGLLAVAALSLWDAVTCQRRGVGPGAVVIFAVWAIVFAVSAAHVLANGRP